MNLSGETLSLAHDRDNERDALIKRGINYGLLVKGWQGEALNPTEEIVAAKLKPAEGTSQRDGVSLTRDEAEAALAALMRNEEFLRRVDTFAMNDVYAWMAIPEIREFVALRGS